MNEGKITLVIIKQCKYKSTKLIFKIETAMDDMNIFELFKSKMFMYIAVDTTYC